MREEEGKFEEFDGFNHTECKHLVLIVHLPLLVRGHAVQVPAVRAQRIEEGPVPLGRPLLRWLVPQHLDDLQEEDDARATALPCGSS